MKFQPLWEHACNGTHRSSDLLWPLTRRRLGLPWTQPSAAVLSLLIISNSSMNESTPLLLTPPRNGTTTNGGRKSTIDNHIVDSDDDDAWLSNDFPVIDMRRPQHEKTVSLLLEDDVEHIFRIVEPGESVEGDQEELHTHIQRERSDSFMSEITEIISEVKEELREVLQEDLTTPIKPRDEGEHAQKLSALSLAVLVFYKVSGGPFGCEPAVKAAGPLLALAGFTALPLLVSIPEALVTAELGSAYPEPSGAVAWVEEAFGPKASLLCGYFHWVSGATDNAIYPSLFLKYVAFYMNSQAFFSTDLVRFLFTAGITILLSLINYSGLHIVGNLSIIICIVSMSPFIIMVLLAIPRLDPRRWFVLPVASVSDDPFEEDDAGFFAAPVWTGVHWRPLLNSLFWNLNSFDVGASFAGEVRDPERVFPRAMFLSVVFVVLSYLLPLLAALGAVDTRQEDWDAGFFTTVAIAMGGAGLGAYTVLASAISNIALFEAEMSGDAYQLMGMADRGLIPKWFTKRSRFGTPVNGIVTGTIVIILMSVADFDQLVEMLNFAYSLSILLEYAAFAKLRITDGDVDRPYRIPLNTFGCVVMIIPPSLFLIFLLAIASRTTYLYFATLLAFGIAFHFFQKVAKHYNWIQYAEAPKRMKKKTMVASPPSNP